MDVLGRSIGFDCRGAAFSIFTATIKLMVVIKEGRK
jgi:hypothetical protein